MRFALLVTTHIAVRVEQNVFVFMSRVDRLVVVKRLLVLFGCVVVHGVEAGLDCLLCRLSDAFTVLRWWSLHQIFVFFVVDDDFLRVDSCLSKPLR